MKEVQNKELSTEELILLIIEGDNRQEEAFSELVLRYRGQAIRWAFLLTRDTFLAEDIVQQAFLTIHRQLHTLQSRELFFPWLKRIIRNQVATYYRKKEHQRVTPIPYVSGTESVNSALRSASTIEELQTQSNSRSIENEETDDISFMLIQKEQVDQLKKYLAELSPHAQKLVEAHYLKGQTAEEIAANFHLNRSNVYNTLSKAKQRLQDLRFSGEVQSYLRTKDIQPSSTGASDSSGKERAVSKGKEPQRLVLPVPSQLTSYTSMGHVLHQLVDYLAPNKFSLTEVMGYSGQAFRLQMSTDGEPVGSFVYEWGRICQQGLAQLGLRSTFIGHPQFTNMTPDFLIDTIDQIRHSLQKGLPVLAWNLSPMEFCLIYGYNDHTQEFIYRDVAHHQLTINYDLLGRHIKHTALFMAIINGKVTHYPLTYDKLFLRDEYHQEQTWLGPSLIQALGGIVKHLKGEEQEIPGYSFGVRAYETWIEAIQKSRLSAGTHAYQVALAAEAREHALEFLKKLGPTRIFVADGKHVKYVQLLKKAEFLYQSINQIYKEIYPTFPYSSTFSGMAQSIKLIKALESLQKLERNAVFIFEDLLDLTHAN